MTEFNYREFLKNNPLLKEEVKDSLITESKQIESSMEEQTTEESEVSETTDIAEEKPSSKMKVSEFKAKIKEEILAALSEADESNEKAQPYTDALRKEEAEGLADDVELEGADAQNFIEKLMKATEGKTWDQFYDIADDIMSQYVNEVTEADKDEEEDVEAEMDVEEPTMAPEVAPEEGLTADEQEIQDSLKIAYDNAVQIGDDKLADQIGNTITFFTRSHVVNK